MRWLLTAVVLLSICRVGPAQLRADERPRLTVSGSGQVKVMPDSAVMLCGVSGEAELAQDAVVKFRDAKRRAVEALEGLGIEGLKVEPMGMSMGAKYNEQAIAMMRGMGFGGGMEAGASTKPKIVARESLRLTVEGIGELEPEAMADLLSGLIESVQDAGLTPGGGDMTQMAYQYGEGAMNIFVFHVSEPEPTLAEARRLAVADARRRAEALAGETGITLGGVVYANEIVMNQNPFGGNHWQTMYLQAMMPQGMAGPSAPVISDTFSPVAVNVQVSMGFEIEPGPAGD